MVTATSWLLGFILAIGFTAAGFAKVTERPMVDKTRNHLGLTSSRYQLIGVAEVLAALGVLLGLWQPLIWVGFLAGIGLLILMVGAVAYHVRVQDHFSEVAPAIAMGFVSFLYLTARAVS